MLKSVSRCISVFFLIALMLACISLVIVQTAQTASAAEVTFEDNGAEVKVLIDGKHFTSYQYTYGVKPIFWPVYSPDGKGLTRDYPMRDPRPSKFPYDSYDHIHQRSVWFTHGDVNGYDFWSEWPGKNCGVILHQEFIKKEAPTFVTRNLWMVRPDKNLLTDERTYTFGSDAYGNWIDMEVKLIASFGDVTFGDTKEGTMGIRVPGILEVNKKQGGKIVNAEGLTNDAAWGKQSPWVDYSGVIDGKNCGVAMMNHPTSARYPTYWHVRTYGLFAANPFGVRDFTGDKNQNGSLVLRDGESVTFKYRLYFHRGDVTEAEIAENFKNYSAQ
ncbi:MAG: PmoA family protein [Planctomycetia bacterium]|nr:PmoA family protein [Planctomycetia bacterium]